MARLAFVFSGQGAHRTGMGRELYDSLPVVRSVFERHEKYRPGTTGQCFEKGDWLQSTLNAQPCLYTLSLAIARALEKEGAAPYMTAGFSLGEISALSFADVFDGDDGFRFVCERAQAMHDASQKHPGGMTAVLNLTNADVEALCREIGGLYPVNYNSPGQVVVAGDMEALKQLALSVPNQGGRALPLRVSGAFHSPFMVSAAQRLTEELENVHLVPPRIPVYGNLTALPYGEDVKAPLIKQVVSPVQWQKTIENMIQAGAAAFIEVGAGTTLTGLIKRIDPNAAAMSVEDLRSFEEAIALAKETTGA